MSDKPRPVSTERLIESNLGIAKLCVNKRRQPYDTIHNEELLSDAFYGLVKGLQPGKYDPTRGSVGNYCEHWINKELKAGRAFRTHLVHVPLNQFFRAGEAGMGLEYCPMDSVKAPSVEDTSTLDSDLEELTSLVCTEIASMGLPEEDTRLLLGKVDCAYSDRKSRLLRSIRERIEALHPGLGAEAAGLLGEVA